jgi:tetratricopeptide (TPR) repeat protein
MASGETDVGGRADSSAKSDTPGASASTARPKKSSGSITELELAFAQDPQSQAFVPLCEAYLDQGRFMEAMVVAKKGIKAHPQSVDAKLLLAHVYARQQKFPRALQEADDVVAAFASNATAYIGRARIRLDASDEKGAIADLKKALDLDAAADEATQLLKARGVVYPEPPPPPPPPPEVPAYSFPPPGAPQPMGRAPSLAGGSLPPAVGPSTGGTTGDLVPRGSSNVYQSTVPRVGSGTFAGGSLPPGISPGYPLAGPPPRARLEGEDELEALAAKVRDAQPQRSGSAKVTLGLAGGALVVLVVGGGLMFHNKRVTEGIAELSRQGRATFMEDTYGSYQRAAGSYEEILKTLDADHAPTLGALAHTYAILWGEHGDTDRKAALDRVLAQAEKKASDNPHTIAARGLVALYGSENRQKAAAAAYEAVWPATKALREQNQDAIGTFADLTLGIIDSEAGNYASAASALQQVVGAMPSSVRARVAYARAALRTGDMGKAEVAFSEALRASRDHPGARAGRALVRLQRGRLESAAQDLVEFDDFAKKSPKQVSDRDRALAEYARSEVVRAAGDDGSARAYYDNAIRLDPGNADFPYGLGRSLLAGGRARDAIEPLTKALEKEPNRRAFMVALAEAETAVGSYDNAEKHLAAALAQDAKDVPASIAKGRLWAAQKKPEAESFLKSVLDWSKAPEANLELGRYYHATGRTQDAKLALEAAATAAENQPPAKKAEIALAYGKLMSDLEDTGTALNSFKQAAEWGAIEAWYRLVQVMVKDGRRDKDGLKAACERYINAGSSLPYAQSARELCAGG